MIISQPILSDIPCMRLMLQPEIDKGNILDRSEEVMANMIRSYHVAWEEEQKLFQPHPLSLESKPFASLQNPQMLGFCALHIHSLSLAEIRSLYVLPNYQRRGIATLLIQNCLKEAKELGSSEVLVLTYQRILFERVGFVEISKDKIPNQKIWADCIACKHFPVCDEIALIKKI